MKEKELKYMINLQIIGIGILLVIMGALFSLLGNIGSIIGFVIAIAVICYLFRGGYFKNKPNRDID